MQVETTGTVAAQVERIVVSKAAMEEVSTDAVLTVPLETVAAMAQEVPVITSPVAAMAAMMRPLWSVRGPIRTAITAAQPAGAIDLVHGKNLAMD